MQNLRMRENWRIGGLGATSFFVVPDCSIMRA
jgi:hypothetical protein